MRTAFITGSAGLLGQAIATKFSRDYVALGLHFRRSQPDVSQLSSECLVELIQQDLSVTEIDVATTAMFDEFEKLSGHELDVLVLNASSQALTPWPELSVQDWDSMYQESLRHTAVMLQIAGERFQKSATANQKVIVVIGSIEGIRPAAGHAPYAVMKAALHHLVTAAAYELGAGGVRVVGVAPGLVARNGIENDWPSGVERWNQSAALKRMVQPEEVANAVHFLASPAASGITGVTIPVDAGWNAHPGW